MNTVETDNANTQPGHRKLLSFVRRGDRMTTSQEAAWNKFSNKYLVQVDRAETDTSIAAGQTVEPESLFGNTNPLVVEIGVGKGEAVVHAANTTPEANFLGIEVFRAGLAKTMMEAGLLDLDNLRVVEANAPEVFEKLLPPASVSEVRVFFPDPWHKSRHNKRRLLTAQFADTLHRALKTDGRVRLATDWQHYADQMKTVFTEHDGFRADFTGDWAERFEGRPLTKFEAKGIKAGRVIRDLTFLKVEAN